MKKILFILSILSPFVANAQKTYVPDNNFEQALISLGYDGVLDDSVLTATISTITNLSVRAKSIQSLVGIKDFIALKGLYIDSNLLTSLNVSNNLALEYLLCGDNQLTSLDVSNNLALEYLDCGDNQLTSLDVSNNLALEFLGCYDNQLTILDVSNNLALGRLYTNINQLTTLDVSNNVALRELFCSFNDLNILDVSNGNNLNLTSFHSNKNINLNCIKVDDTLYSQTNWTGIYFAFDPQSKFSLSCNWPLNIAEVKNNLTANTYPNPTTGVLNIEFDNEGNYSLFSIDGKQVLKSGLLQSEKTSIDISSLRTGMYLLRVVTEEGDVITKRVIKQ